VAVASPLVLHAQPLAKAARRGFPGSASPIGSAKSVETLRNGSRDRLSLFRSSMRNDSSWSRKVCPYVVPVAALSNPDNPVSKPIIPAMRAAPRPLKLEFEVAEAQRIRPSFAAIASLAVAKKLASIGAQEICAGWGIGYGVDLLGLYRRTAYFIDKSLKDAKPADLPIEQPTQFEFGNQPQHSQHPRAPNCTRNARACRRNNRVAGARPLLAPLRTLRAWLSNDYPA
jgi:hypothetical protein